MSSTTRPALPEPKGGRYLPALVDAIRRVHDEGTEISTESFAALMDVAVRVFDYMGTVMHIAKHEMVVKTASLHAAGASHPLLREVVEADKVAGKATVKDSCARNLHRLACAIKFVRVLLQEFLRDPRQNVREAAGKAYEQSLAPLHIYIVRTAVWAGMYMLPTREHFMRELGETDETAMQLARDYLEFGPQVENAVFRLFDGLDMPVSTPASTVLASLWTGGSVAPPAAAKAAS